MNTYINGLNYTLPHPFRAEADRMIAYFETEAIKVDGIIRWKSNGNVPPQEVLDFWKHVNKRFNMAKSIAAREREQKAFLMNYKKNQSLNTRPLSAEQRYEMEAAFGKGATVVDIITGKKTKL